MQINYSSNKDQKEKLLNRENYKQNKKGGGWEILLTITLILADLKECQYKIRLQLSLFIFQQVTRKKNS